MNTLAPPSVPARRFDTTDGLRPPAPTQAAVPQEFASLTWPADVAASALPAPTEPIHHWDAPTTSAVGEPDDAPAPVGWNWTPIMDRAEPMAVPAVPMPAPSLRDADGSVSVRLDQLEALFDAQTNETTSEAPDAVSDATLDAIDIAAEPVIDVDDEEMPSITFEPATGSVTTQVAAPDTAVVTATVPAFVTYAPATPLVLPVAPPREPVAVEVRRAVVSLPPQRRAKPRRSGRASAVVLVLAAAVSAAAYLGFREYIYGDTDVASDGTRVVEVEPARTIVVVDAP